LQTFHGGEISPMNTKMIPSKTRSIVDKNNFIKSLRSDKKDKPLIITKDYRRQQNGKRKRSELDSFGVRPFL
jgi:hypothetical protein